MLAFMNFQPIEEITEEHFDKMFDLNVRGANTNLKRVGKTF